MSRLQPLVRHRDALAAAVIAVMYAIEYATGGYARGPLAANIAVGCAIALAIAVSARRPLAAQLVVLALACLQTLVLTPFFDPSASFLVFIYLAYFTALRTAGGRAWASLAAAAIACTFIGATSSSTGNTNFVLAGLGLSLPFWLAGRGQALGDRLNRQLEARARRIEGERDQRARLAAAEERARIADELETIVTVQVREIAYRAEAAAKLIADEPRAAAGVLQSIAAIGRHALTEMRSLLGVLREANAAGPTVASTPATAADLPARAPRRLPAIPLYARTVGRLPEPRQDLVVTLFWLVLLALIAFTGAHGTSTVALAVSVVILALPLYWRRRAPAIVLGVLILVAPLGLLTATGPHTFVALLVALYAAGRYEGPLERRLGLLMPLGTCAVMSALTSPQVAGDVLFPLLFMLLAWSAGRSVRRRDQLADLLADNADRLAAERAARERAAVVDERLRIARELHDAVANAIGVVVLHATAAARLAERRPQTAAGALRQIEESAATALAEVDELVGEPTVDAAGLSKLSRLAENARAGGLELELDVDPELPPLEPLVDRVAYRVVQEALTNAVKHAAPTTATVRIAAAGDALEIEVRDAGRARAGAAATAALAGAGGGHGLTGMRERIARAGGRLSAGPLPGPAGGFRVHARLPLAAAAADPRQFAVHAS